MNSNDNQRKIYIRSTKTWVPVLRTAVIFFYLSNEGVSMLENAGHLGLPIPAKLKDILVQLHNRSEDK